MVPLWPAPTLARPAARRGVNESEVEIAVHVHMRNVVLRDRRRTLGLTQQQVAQAAGIANGTYNQIENLKHWPTPSTQERICTALGVISEMAFTIEYEAATHPGKVERIQRVEAQAVAHFRDTWQHDEERLQNPETALLEENRQEVVDTVLTALTPRERHILWETVAMKRTLRDLAADLGISSQRVGDLREKALHKLRVRCTDSPGWRELLDAI
jgi:RNA polymerase sigma factor (sigma-70 family)